MITLPELVARSVFTAKVHQEVYMTRRTQFKGNSRSRRRERLKAKALANGVLAREEAISSEVLHRPTPSSMLRRSASP